MGNGCTSVKAVQISNSTSNSALSNLKLVIIGENLSGKSSIVRRYEKNSYIEGYEPTKTVNIVSIVKKVNVPDERIVAIELWEIPSHGSVEMHRTYYQNVDAAIVTMDLSDEDSYVSAAQWKKDVCMHRNNQSTLSLKNNHESYEQRNDIFPVLLLGNKYDVVKQAVLRNSVKNLADSDISSDITSRNRMNGVRLPSEIDLHNHSKLNGRQTTAVDDIAQLNGDIPGLNGTRQDENNRNEKESSNRLSDSPERLATTANADANDIDDSVKTTDNDANDASDDVKKVDNGNETNKDDAKETGDGAKKDVDGAKEVGGGAERTDDGARETGDRSKKVDSDVGMDTDGAKRTGDGSKKVGKRSKKKGDGAKRNDDGTKKKNDGAKNKDDGVKKEGDGTKEFKDDAENAKSDDKSISLTAEEDVKTIEASLETEVAAPDAKSNNDTAKGQPIPDPHTVTSNPGGGESGEAMMINDEVKPDHLESSQNNHDIKETNQEAKSSENFDQPENKSVSLNTEAARHTGENGAVEIENMEVAVDQPMERICNQVESAIISNGDDDTRDKDANSQVESGSDGSFAQNVSKPKLKKLFPKDLNSQTDSDLTDQTFPGLTSSSVRASSLSLSLMASCVGKLELFAEENGFIAGIPVSAKDAKGGVHEAIQSLLRHLLSSKGDSSERKRKNDELSLKSHVSTHKRTKKTQNSDITEEFESLQNVGIIEIDDVLTQCNPALSRAEDITASYWETLRDFKRICHAKGVIAEKRSSLEECISALKDAVATWQHSGRERNDVRMSLLLRDQPQYSLVAAEGVGFVTLHVVDDDNRKVELDGSTTLPSHVAALLEFYHRRVHKVCSTVATEATGLLQQLEQLLVAISDKEDKAWDTAVAAGRSQVEVRRILTGLAQARTRMRGTLEQVRDARKSVVDVQAKIRAVLLF